MNRFIYISAISRRGGPGERRAGQQENSCHNIRGLVFSPCETMGETSKKYWPAHLDLSGRTCLVVGGGAVGERKVLGLLEAGASVNLVSREMTARLDELAAEGRVILLGPDYRPEHMEGAVLVFAATSDPELNSRVGRDALERGAWVNVADQPDLCTFIVPATVRRGDLAISVSTGGASPALAARIRARLEDQFGPEYETFLDLMALVRAGVLAQGQPSDRNRELFRQLVDSDVLENLALGDPGRAEETLVKLLGPDFTFSALGFTYSPEADS